MPTYEYKCKKCGHVFEEFQKMSDDPVEECPECGGEVIRVIHGGTGLIFKGSGWYVTDYGKGRSSATTGESSGGCTSCCGGSCPAPDDPEDD